MPNLTPEKEEQILEALRAKFASVDGASNVVIDDEIFDSKQDIIDQLTVQNVDTEVEVKYIFLSLLGFADSATDGCDDSPSVTLRYNAHVVQGYKAKRSDDSTPKKDFKALIFALRNKFLLKNRKLAAVENCETTPLVPKNDVLLDDDPLTGAFGYIVDFLVKVEIT